jgi:hypothetical protein
VWVTSDKWGPFKDRMLHLSYGQASLFLLMMDFVDGQVQGGVVKFPLDFDTGVCRGRVGPDGQVYLAGLAGWQTRGARDGAFHRVRYTGKPVYMPTELHVHSGAIAITFTQELDPDAATDPDSYSVEQWNYLWTSDYGSPEVSVENPEKKGHDTVALKSVELSPDKKTVTLHIPELKPVMQMKIAMKIAAADGTPIEYEIYNTINSVPGYHAPPSTRPSTQGSRPTASSN